MEQSFDEHENRPSATFVVPNRSSNAGLSATDPMQFQIKNENDRQTNNFKMEEDSYHASQKMPGGAFDFTA